MEEVIETYTLTTDCRYCGRQVTLIVAKGVEVRDGLLGLYSREMTAPWTRREIHCPTCDSMRMKIDKRLWPIKHPEVKIIILKGEGA